MPYLGLVLSPCLHGNGTVFVHADRDIDRPAAHVAVLDVLLLVDRIIDGDVDGFAAVGTMDGFEWKHVDYLDPRGVESAGFRGAGPSA